MIHTLDNDCASLSFDDTDGHEDAANTFSDEEGLYHRRMVEALIFASHTPLSLTDIAQELPKGVDVKWHLESLMKEYESRGVNLVAVSGKYMFATASDLSFLLQKEVEEQRKLSRAAVETLSIIAYHQPVTRAEIEEIRGVGLSKGTLDVLMEALWIRPIGRRKTPGRPVTYGTTENFLVHFGLETIKNLPGLAELQAAGLLDSVDQTLLKMGKEFGASERHEDDRQIDLEDIIEEHMSQNMETESEDGNLY